MLLLFLCCIYEERVIRPRPWAPHQKPVEKVTKPVEKEDEIRSAGDALILVVPESVQSVSVSDCTRQKKMVRHRQVRFFDVPTGECRIRFSPSGAFTKIEGGVGLYRCNFLSHESSIICLPSVE